MAHKQKILMQVFRCRRTDFSKLQRQCKVWRYEQEKRFVKGSIVPSV